MDIPTPNPLCFKGDTSAQHLYIQGRKNPPMNFNTCTKLLLPDAVFFNSPNSLIRFGRLLQYSTKWSEKTSNQTAWIDVKDFNVKKHRRRVYVHQNRLVQGDSAHGGFCTTHSLARQNIIAHTSHPLDKTFHAMFANHHVALAPSPLDVLLALSKTRNSLHLLRDAFLHSTMRLMSPTTLKIAPGFPLHFLFKPVHEISNMWHFEKCRLGRASAASL